MAYTSGSHECPAPGCRQRVPNRLFACRSHWFMLSQATRDDIYATSSLPTIKPERLEVIQRAAREWERSSHT